MLVRIAAGVAVFFAFAARPAFAYSQFTHEELIDLLWADSIRPLLLRRYPFANEEALRRAHAFAYGGCVMQDIGYYPLGKTFFSDLAHYVRSGDFVATLFHDARNLEEFAFAIGALSHYVGDSIGHSQAVNPSTAEDFPRLEAKYGPVVTYEEAPYPHIQTEFGFDVAQTAFQHYAPAAYRRHIGFRVGRPIMYRAFRDTYGISASGILGPARSALRTYRWSVTRLVPAFLRAEVVRFRGKLPAEVKDGTESEFLRAVSRSEYASLYSAPYSHPGAISHLLAFVVVITPKVGRLKVLAVKRPPANTEDLFLESADHAVAALRRTLDGIPANGAITLQLENLDLDTGHRAVAGESKIVDRTYARLLVRVVAQDVPITPGLRRALLDFYADPNQQPSDPKTKDALTELREEGP